MESPFDVLAHVLYEWTFNLCYMASVRVSGAFKFQVLYSSDFHLMDTATWYMPTCSNFLVYIFLFSRRNKEYEAP